MMNIGSPFTNYQITRERDNYNERVEPKVMEGGDGLLNAANAFWGGKTVYVIREGNDLKEVHEDDKNESPKALVIALRVVLIITVVPAVFFGIAKFYQYLAYNKVTSTTNELTPDTNEQIQGKLSYEGAEIEDVEEENINGSKDQDAVEFDFKKDFSSRAIKNVIDPFQSRTILPLTYEGKKETGLENDSQLDNLTPDTNEQTGLENAHQVIPYKRGNSLMKNALLNYNSKNLRIHQLLNLIFDRNDFKSFSASFLRQFKKPTVSDSIQSKLTYEGAEIEDVPEENIKRSKDQDAVEFHFETDLSSRAIIKVIDPFQSRTILALTYEGKKETGEDKTEDVLQGDLIRKFFAYQPPKTLPASIAGQSFSSVAAEGKKKTWAQRLISAPAPTYIVKTGNTTATWRTAKTAQLTLNELHERTKEMNNQKSEKQKDSVSEPSKKNLRVFNKNAKRADARKKKREQIKTELSFKRISASLENKNKIEEILAENSNKGSAPVKEKTEEDKDFEHLLTALDDIAKEKGIDKRELYQTLINGLEESVELDEYITHLWNLWENDRPAYEKEMNSILKKEESFFENIVNDTYAAASEVFQVIKTLGY